MQLQTGQTPPPSFKRRRRRDQKEVVRGRGNSLTGGQRYLRVAEQQQIMSHLIEGKNV